MYRKNNPILELKLTEDETVNLLHKYLKSKGWKNIKTCLGHTRGIDIEAEKDKKMLFVEVKGARANRLSPIKKREKFDKGQIKTHFGRAIVKMLDLKFQHPDAMLAIAHPNDDDIKKAISHMIPFLQDIGIRHYWVSENNITTQ